MAKALEFMELIKDQIQVIVNYVGGVGKRMGIDCDYNTTIGTMNIHLVVFGYASLAIGQ